MIVHGDSINLQIKVFDGFLMKKKEHEEPENMDYFKIVILTQETLFQSFVDLSNQNQTSWSDTKLSYDGVAQLAENTCLLNFKESLKYKLLRLRVPILLRLFLGVKKVR